MRPTRSSAGGVPINRASSVALSNAVRVEGADRLTAATLDRASVWRHTPVLRPAATRCAGSCQHELRPGAGDDRPLAVTRRCCANPVMGIAQRAWS